MTTNGGIVSATTTQLNPRNGWACQRVLTAQNNVVIDATGCSFNASDQGVNVATQIAANVPT